MTYTATLEANGTEFIGKGATIEDALTNIPLNMLFLKTKSTLTIQGGKKKTTRQLTLLQGRALLRSPLNKVVTAKQLNDSLR